MKENSYGYLKSKYPDYIIIQKAGCFYDVRDFGAIFFSQVLGYKTYSDQSSNYKIGIPLNVIYSALDFLIKSNYKYIITENYKIIDQYDDGISVPIIEEPIEEQNNTDEIIIKTKKILDAECSRVLFKKLKQYCNNKANELNLPTYCVCENEYIKNLVKELPLDLESLESIEGFGEKRIEKYGADFISIINEYLKTDVHYEEIEYIEEIKTKKTRNKEVKTISLQEPTKILTSDSLTKLTNLIKKYRTGQAANLGVPPYCIFDDKSLNLITKYLPTTIEDLKCIPGFKEKRCEKYGNAIIEIISNFVENKAEFETAEEHLTIQEVSDDGIDIDTINEEKNYDFKLNIEDVLNCIIKYNGKYSYKGIIKILKGYFGFKFIPEMRNSEYYGLYKDLDDSEIAKALDYLIEKDIVIDDYKIRIKEDDNIEQDYSLSRNYHEQRLQRIFGHKFFKDWQWNIIKNLLNKKRILSIEKTGGGKSLCFQYTADYIHSFQKGVTIVFSPLQALMREQVQYLKSIGVKAECIISTILNSSEQNKEHQEIYEKLINNEVSILYIAPERLSNSMWMEYCSKIKINMIVIDEAHCISTWGHDFRIDYRRIVDLVKLLPPSIPILGLTATANDVVAKDIQEQIGHNLQIIRGALERQNLNLNVIKTNSLEEKFIYAKKFILSQEGHGILYAGTQADTKIISDWLNYSGIKSTYYHAGLSDERRKEIELDLKNDTYKVIVSTNALGMGMDKKDVRFVVHSHLPSSLIAYYQEIGRAGRDNLDSNILLLYNDDDEDLQKYFIDTSKPSKKHYIQTLNNLKNHDMGLFDLMKLVNVKKATMKLILKDLEDKGHIERSKNFTYSFIKEMSNEEYELINQYKEIRYEDLAKMLQYIHLNTCRTKFICNYLNDNSVNKCNHCDNCTTKIKIQLEDFDFKLLKNFFAEYFIYEETPNCKIVSSGYYKIAEIGKLVKDSKYRNKGYFAESLLDRVIKAYEKYYSNYKFDNILFVPPSISGDLVENFAERISKKTNIQFSKDLIKIKETEISLKEVKSKIKKRELLKGVFELKNSENYINKTILLIDDIIDSGVTVDEISKLLLKNGIKEVCVLTIAKTTVGDD